MIRSSNPALNSKTFEGASPVSATDRMTLGGTVNRTAMLLFILMATAAYTWNVFFSSMGMPGDWGEAVDAGGGASAVMPYLLVGGIGGFIFALITIFKKTWAPFTAPVYAGLEGLFLGGISSMMELRFPGIVIQAAALTFGILFSLLAAYKSGMIKATENFKLGVAAATGGIFLIYLVSIVLGMFGVGVPLIHESGVVGIGFSLFVVVIASLNLVLDFDFIEAAVDRGSPKYMEWVGAFGLIVTLVWLYIEILHLLAKMRQK